MTRPINAWLQAGVMEVGERFPPEAGGPQGGPLSPLLANAALHGLEEMIGQAFPRRGRTPAVSRDADDRVVLHPDREVIEQGQALMAHGLREIGVELKRRKTRIRHTLEVVEGEAGFDCLGFNIRQYPSRARRGDKTIIKPSRVSVTRHHRQVREVTTRHRMQRQRRLIEALNPVIRGWSHDCSTVCSKETFGKLDDRLRQRCRACGYRLKMGDVLEVDHILARAQGGRDEAAHWQLLLRYCHMEKTAQERRRCAGQAPHA